MGMRTLIGKFFIDLVYEMIFKLISHNFIVTNRFDDNGKIFQKVIKKVLFLHKELIVLHHKICNFLSSYSDSILLIDVIENRNISIDSIEVDGFYFSLFLKKLLKLS